MRHVHVASPSFPEVTPDQPLAPPQPEMRWAVVCGDRDHWRCGYYSPEHSRAEQVTSLEQHTCPELFLLISGRVSLVLGDPAVGPEDEQVTPTRIIALEAQRPILISAPHGGFCPDGPHTGVCLVIERDAFSTRYRDSRTAAEPPSPVSSPLPQEP